MVKAKCTIIHLVTISRAIGRMIWKKGKEPWIGQICDKNISGSGTTTISMDGVSIFGCNQKARVNIFEIATKVTGQMELDKDMVFSITLMGQNMKATGKTTWSKDSLSIQTKMGKSLIWCLIKTECSNLEFHLSFSKAAKKLPIKNRFSQMHFLSVYKFSTYFILSLQIWKPYITFCSEITLN